MIPPTHLTGGTYLGCPFHLEQLPRAPKAQQLPSCHLLTPAPAYQALPHPAA